MRVSGDLFSACDAFRGPSPVACRSLMLLGANSSIETIAPGQLAVEGLAIESRFYESMLQLGVQC